jgi:hypothetical protein
MMARMKELEDENGRPKRIYAEERMKAEIVAGTFANANSLPEPLQSFAALTDSGHVMLYFRSLGQVMF